MFRISIQKLKIYFLISLIITFIFSPFQSKVYAYQDSKMEKLTEKIATGYSNKFCNAIGMGISRDGATKLAIMENEKSKFNTKLWSELLFSGEKNINKLKDQDIDLLISTIVINKCGDAINLKGDKGIEEFSTYFKNIKSSLYN